MGLSILQASKNAQQSHDQLFILHY